MNKASSALEDSWDTIRESIRCPRDEQVSFGVVYHTGAFELDRPIEHFHVVCLMCYRPLVDVIPCPAPTAAQPDLMLRGL